MGCDMHFLVAAGDERTHDLRSDKSCSTRHQYSHLAPPKPLAATYWRSTIAQRSAKADAAGKVRIVAIRSGEGAMRTISRTTAEGGEQAPEAFDAEALRRKYREERDKRLREDGNEQYQEVRGDFSRYLEACTAVLPGDRGVAQRRHTRRARTERSIQWLNDSKTALLGGLRSSPAAALGWAGSWCASSPRMVAM